MAAKVWQPAVAAAPQNPRHSRPHPAPFDAALLYSKLEAHRLEQDASRRRRHAHDLPRNGIYVPTNAAAQFATTATPMKDQIKPAKASRSRRSQPIARPPPLPTEPVVAADGTFRGNPKAMYAAMSIGMSEVEMLAASAASHPGEHGSVQVVEHRSPRPRDPTRAKETRESLGPHDPSVTARRSKPSGRRERSVSPMAAYMPGDAARRRPITEPRPASSAFVGLSFAPHPFLMKDIPTHRLARDQDNDMPYDMNSSSDDDHQHHHHGHPRGARPRIYDRNDWAQASQYGGSDDTRRHTMTLPSLPHVNKLKPEHAPDRRPSAQSDHLITDAVRLIKKEGRLKRRESIMGFFKKF